MSRSMHCESMRRLGRCDAAAIRAHVAKLEEENDSLDSDLCDVNEMLEKTLARLKCCHMDNDTLRIWLDADLDVHVAYEIISEDNARLLNARDEAVATAEFALLAESIAMDENKRLREALNGLIQAVNFMNSNARPDIPGSRLRAWQAIWDAMDIASSALAGKEE
jgi:hypothetical protein